MTGVYAVIGGGGALFIAWVVTRLIVVARSPRGNRCARGKNVLPPPSPACERSTRLAER